MDRYLQAAIDQAIKSLEQGGIPIGSVLVVDDEIGNADESCRYGGKAAGHRLHEHLGKPVDIVVRGPDARQAIDIAGIHECGDVFLLESLTGERDDLVESGLRDLGSKHRFIRTRSSDGTAKIEISLF